MWVSPLYLSALQMVYQDLAESDTYASVEDEDEVDCGTQAVKCPLKIMIIR